MSLCGVCHISAYHRLFNLVVDGHNASTRGTAEDKEKRPLFNSSTYLTSTRPQTIRKTNILRINEFVGRQWNRKLAKEKGKAVYSAVILSIALRVWSGFYLGYSVSVWGTDTVAYIAPRTYLFKVQTDSSKEKGSWAESIWRQCEISKYIRHCTREHLL